MADWGTCFNWLLDNEDRTRAYKTVPDYPPGAFAISGINSKSFPVEFASIDDVPQAQRGPLVEQFYRTKFWNVWFDRITSTEVAKRVFDCAVNNGPGTAVKILQRSINTITPSTVMVDATWGPGTLNALNGEDEAAMVKAFQDQRLSYYQQVAANDPNTEVFLGTADEPGAWWKRAIA